jgi:type II secretory pathway predicted ATPase ExeA/phage tail protein X
MYERFFNLREKPFNLTPSSRFLYLGEAHKEALALLRYGVMERKGFVLLTGEVGTGKTTVAHAFLGELDKRVHCVYLSNPLLTPQDLYNYLASSALKKRVICKSKASFILYFEAFLRERLKNREVFVLVIDEAQRLSYELLEEIRLLSNMETAEEKLINIFLIGQPELNKKLNDPKCRPLLQRISIRYHIKPLNLEETIEYLATRLSVAGAEDTGKIFPKQVAEAIYEYSQGYPRVINNLADNVLLLAFSKNQRKIVPEFVERCYEDMQLQGSLLAKDQEEMPEEKKIIEIRTKPLRRLMFLLLFLVLGSLGFLGGFEISQRARAVLSHIETYLPQNAQAWLAPQEREKITGTVRQGESSVNAGGAEKEAMPEDLQRPKVEVEDKETAAETTPAAPVDSNVEAQYPSGSVAGTGAKAALAGGPEDAESAQNERSLGFITVREGDTLIGLALKHYGRADETILEWLQEKNPKIRNINRIEIGQRIYFPDCLASADPLR